MEIKQTSIWRAGVTIDHLRERVKNTMVEHLGIELTDLGPDFLSGTMPVDERTCQPMGFLHGGASVAFAETLASLAANAVVDLTRYACVGQEINANHLRSVPKDSKVTGVTRPFHIGVRSQVWGIEIVEERRGLICVSRITMSVIEAQNPKR